MLLGRYDGVYLQDYEVDKISCNGTLACSISPISSYTHDHGCADCNDDGDICDLSCDLGSCVFERFTTDSQGCYTGPMGTAGVGECRFGFETCSMGSFGPCSDIVPTAEICDGLDNDCDGSADESVCACTPGDTRPCYPGNPAEVGNGPCVGGLQTL
ncbi:MAG: MopE-related protein [bacterium]